VRCGRLGQFDLLADRGLLPRPEENHRADGFGGFRSSLMGFQRHGENLRGVHCFQKRGVVGGGQRAPPLCDARAKPRQSPRRRIHASRWKAGTSPGSMSPYGPLQKGRRLSHEV